jgi:hypothetical protein
MRLVKAIALCPIPKATVLSESPVPSELVFIVQTAVNSSVHHMWNDLSNNPFGHCFSFVDILLIPHKRPVSLFLFSPSSDTFQNLEMLYFPLLCKKT